MRSAFTLSFALAAVALAAMIFWVTYESNVFGWFPRQCPPAPEICILS